MKNSICFMLLLIGPLLQLSAEEESHPDKFVRNQEVKGIFVAFEQGDYWHAVVETDTGKKESFFIEAPDDCFLALHKGKSISIKYKVLERYFPEGAGYYPANVITSVKTPNASLDSWKKKIKGSEPETCKELREKYLVKSKGS